MFKVIDGYKVYILAAIGVIVGLAELAGIDVIPSVDQSNAIPYIWAALMAAAGRSAVKKAEV